MQLKRLSSRYRYAFNIILKNLMGIVMTGTVRAVAGMSS